MAEAFSFINGIFTVQYFYSLLVTKHSPTVRLQRLSTLENFTHSNAVKIASQALDLTICVQLPPAQRQNITLRTTWKLRIDPLALSLGKFMSPIKTFYWYWWVSPDFRFTLILKCKRMKRIKQESSATVQRKIDSYRQNLRIFSFTINNFVFVLKWE